MKSIFVCVFFTLSVLSFSQNSKIDSLASKELNLKWIENLQMIESKEDQLNLIKEKIKADSIVSDADLRGERTNRAHSQGFEMSKCKVLIVLQHKTATHLLDMNISPNYSSVLEYLNNETIDKIEIIDKDINTYKYGTRAMCGVIILKSNDKKLKKIIRKNDRANRYIKKIEFRKLKKDLQ